ncbi:hypothetical protein BH11MYX1_BH11MYX1_02180 [soil metagenome]
MAKAALVAVGVALLAAGGAVAGYGATRKTTGGMTPETSTAMTSAIGQLDGDIRAAQAAVKGAAESLAGLGPVQGAVATDKLTVNGMVEHGELAITSKPGEVIELGQTLKGGTPTALLIQPASAMRSAHAGKIGSYVEIMGDHALVTEVTAVVPKDRARELDGYVMVSRPLDLSTSFAKIDAAHVSGTFEIDGNVRALGTPIAGGTHTTMLLPSVPGAKITVDAPPVKGGPSLPLEAGGGGAAGLGLLVLILGLVTGKSQQARAYGQPVTQSASATPVASLAAAPQLGHLAQLATAQTAASMAAAGTPAPIDSLGGFTTSNLEPGGMIGRWEIIRRIGSGGMADVYLARARGEGGFEKQVAVKVMHPHLARNERAVEHFLDEAKLAARISHPNVVQIQDLGKIGSDYVIVMEFVDGIDLEKLLAAARASQRPLPLEVALGILCRICDGLEAAHRATSADGAPMNLVHRDVKSANVLVSRQGGVKVVDFGIAKAASQNHLTMAGETKGTPSMMAPEQRVGDEVDVRADVYSVGAVAFEILTNHGVNLDLATLAHLGVENWPHLPMPSTLRAGLPVELDGLLMSCMAYDRTRRPADCAALGGAFEVIMKKHGLTASDKDIARWVSSEAAALVVAATGTTEPHVSR